MTTAAAPRDLSLRTPVLVSAAMHAAVLLVLLVTRGPGAPPAPPTYRVSLIAAPPGPRAVGVVQPVQPPSTVASTSPAPAPPARAPTAKAPGARTMPDVPGMRAPARAKTAPAPKVATPNVAAGSRSGDTKTTTAPAAAPVAGGGPTGGRGTDVANVQVDGIAFPYPGYLENVVRQIALRFKPPGGRPLTAVVAFLIRRDGSVTGITLTRRSGVYSFDTEAMGAVDAAAQARAFQPLPQGFSDDVLPVIFSFDPRLIR